MEQQDQTPNEIKLSNVTKNDELILLTEAGCIANHIDVKLNGEMLCLPNTIRSWRKLHEAMVTASGSWQHIEMDGVASQGAPWLECPAYKYRKKVFGKDLKGVIRPRSI
jgi:hypothetical protein